MPSMIYRALRVPAEFSGFAHASLEGQVVDVGDMIAYSTHDLDDALHIGLADEHQLAARGIELWIEALQHADHVRSEEHTSELQSPCNLVCRLLLEKKKKSDTATTRLHLLIVTILHNP